MGTSHKVCLTVVSMPHVHGPSHLRTVGYVTPEYIHASFFSAKPEARIAEALLFGPLNLVLPEHVIIDRSPVLCKVSCKYLVWKFALSNI